MAKVKNVIEQLNVIANAAYMGPASARPTYHKKGFDRLQGSASQVADILTQNPNPNDDQQENITAQFDTMDKAVELYCKNTRGTKDVRKAFDKASKEWNKLVEEWQG
jgi:hypothetical protein